MQLTQFKALEAGRRIQAFLDSHVALLGTLVSALVRRQLDDAVARLESLGTDQDNAADTAMGETAARLTARASMYDRFLQRIATVAEQALPGVPDLGLLIVTSKVANDGRAIEFERQVGNVLATAPKYAQALSDYGLSADFFTQLATAFAAYKSSAQEGGRQTGRRTAATTGLKSVERSFRKTVALLDSAITPALADNPDVLRDWQSTSRVRATTLVPNPTGTPVEQDAQATQGSQNAPATPAPAAPTLTVATNKAA